MKNNFITKIIGATLAFAMMIGGAVGIFASKEAKMVDADSTDTISLVPDNESTGNNASSYVTSHYGFSYGGVNWSFNQWNPKTLQIKTNQDNATSEFNFYTGVFPGNVTEVVLTFSALTVSNTQGFKLAHKATAYTSAQNSGGETMTWDSSAKTLTWSKADSTDRAIAFYQNGKVASGTNKISQIDVTYTVSSAVELAITSPSYLVDGTSGTIKGVISNNDNYTITWSSDNANVSFEPATSSSDQNVTFAFNGVETGETPIEITATLNDTSSTSATKNVYALEHAGTSVDPFSPTDARVFAHSQMAAQTGGDWYVGGYVVGTIQTNKGYYLDEDPTALSSHKFEIYNSGTIANNTGKEIIVGTSYVVAHGSMTCYNNSQSEITGAILVSVDNGNIPSISIDGGNRTVDLHDEVTLTVTKEYDEGATVSWTSSNTSVATVSGGAVTLLSVGSTNITASMTVNQTEYTSTITLRVVENLLEDGDTFIIKAAYDDDTYYLTGVASNLGTVGTTSGSAMIFTAIESTTPGQFRFKNENNYLSYSGSDSKLYTTTDGTTNATLWTALNNGTNQVIESVNVSGRTLQFNYNSGTNMRFACYSSSQTAIQIEKIVPPQVDEVILDGDTVVNANNATSITKEFLYEVTYVSNVGTGVVNVSVVNSNDGESGASVTSAPLNGSFSVTFTASDTYTVTVTSDEDSSKSASLSVVVSNIFVPTVTDYLLYTGTNVNDQTVLTEGDYLITSDSYALKAAINSGTRAQNETIEINGNKISTELTDIVWHIAPSGNYFTLYNAAQNKYLAATSAKNQAQLMADSDDNKAKWTVTIDNNGKFEFENLARKGGSDPNNKWLRNNGTNGWACYGTGTGKSLTLYKLSGYNHLNNTETIKTISGVESNGGATVEQVALRFGAIIPVAEWTALKNAWGISEYGIIFARQSMLTERGLSSAAAVFLNDSEDIGRVYNDTGSNPNASGDNYIFTARLNLESEDYNEVFYAVPYILAGGNYYFLQEVHYSVRTLADECLTNGGSSLSQTALTTLKGNN